MSRRRCLAHLGIIATSLLVNGIANAQPGPLIARTIPCLARQSIAGRELLAPLPQLRVEAAALNAFTVRISWVGQVGSNYTVREIGGAYQRTIPRIVSRPDDPNASTSSSTTTTPRPLSVAHEGALPGSSHQYEVKEQLSDGTQVCGTATATTPTPPLLTVSGQYVDTHHVTVTFKQPPLAFTTRLLRPPRPVYESNVNPNDIVFVNDIGRPGHYNAAASVSGDNISLTVDPGPPPSPYSPSGQYNRGPLTYPFTLEAEWTENPDGTGRNFTLRQPFQVQGLSPIIGYADLHSHQFAYYGFGGSDPAHHPFGRHFFGRAFDKDGDISKALPECTPEHGAGGTLDLGDSMMNMNAGHPRWGHFVHGYPNFDGWPRWNSFTHQAYYEDWLKRAHDAGLKLIVVHPVNNEWMCTTLNQISIADIAAFVGTFGGTLPVIASEIALSQSQIDEGCKDKYAAVNQINEAFAMQAAIDARSGGPGMGWYRIVKSPSEARSVIAKGQLAVVLGMEVDNPFECTVDNADCASTSGELPVYVKSQLDDYYNMGVRHFFPIHFYDNAFGGSANSNFLITNRWRNQMLPRDCASSGYEYDSHTCNANGLTKSGEALIRALMSKGMIIDVDHMSERSYEKTMTIVGPNHYPVVSSHAGFTEIAHGSENNEGNRTPSQVKDIISLGGMFAVIPHQGGLSEIAQYPAGSNIPHRCGNSSETVAQAYRYIVAKNGGGPVGFGTDLNGFAGWPGPRFGSEACPGDPAAGYDPNSMAKRLTYPFTIKATGVSITLDHSVVGGKTFDFNTDGFAHIGMLPDMVADFQALGMSAEELDPLFLSAEGYIRLWEQAEYMAPVTH